MVSILSKYRIKLLTKLQCEYESVEYFEKCRDYIPSSFSRSRVLTFQRLIVLLMKIKTSYQRELDLFCKEIFKGEYNIREVTKGALSQARAKLNPYAFTRLQEITVETFYEDAPYDTWNTFRLLAVDGSVLNLPYSKSIIEEFGKEDYITKASGVKSMARCSILYDVVNQVTLDAQISGYRTSEKTLLESHLGFLKEGDLILGDRGYAYSSIIHWLSDRNVDFCFRFHENKLNVVKEFLKSKKEEIEFDFPLGKRSQKTLKSKKEIKPVRIRLIKVKLDNGTIEVLGTSLLEKEKYPVRIFKNLYHKRWGVEEAFKMLKSRMKLEDFSGKTARSIRQDFHAKILMMTLCAVMSHPIEQKVRDEYSAEKRGNKYNQKINRADAIAETRNNIFAIFISKSKQIVIDTMDNIILASRSIIRPNRSNKRTKQVPKRKPLNYKNL